MRGDKSTMSSEALERLADLMRVLNPLARAIALARGDPHDAERITKRHGPRHDSERQARRSVRSRDLRLPKPGTLIRRIHANREIVVRVLDRGFEYDGRPYRSLSAIAKRITGAHWNGLLFFGLVTQEK